MANFNTNIKNWYIEKFPTDELGEEINDYLDFKNLFKEIMDERGFDLYELIGVGDSVVRERVIDELVAILNDIYNAWLSGKGLKIKDARAEKRLAEIEERLNGNKHLVAGITHYFNGTTFVPVVAIKCITNKGKRNNEDYEFVKSLGCLYIYDEDYDVYLVH